MDQSNGSPSRVEPGKEVLYCSRRQTFWVGLRGRLILCDLSAAMIAKGLASWQAIMAADRSHRDQNPEKQQKKAEAPHYPMAHAQPILTTLSTHTEAPHYPMAHAQRILTTLQHTHTDFSPPSAHTQRLHTTYSLCPQPFPCTPEGELHAQPGRLGKLSPPVTPAALHEAHAHCGELLHLLLPAVPCAAA